MSATPIADMVRQMLEAGSLPAMIVLAVATVELDRIPRETSRDGDVTRHVTSRSPGAVRAARYRENIKQKQGEAKANDVASTVKPSVTPERDASRDGVTACCDSFFKEENTTEEEVRKKNLPVVVETKAKRGARLNPGQPLSDADLKFAIDAGMTAERARQAWAEFGDYWIAIPGQRGAKSNWPATWRNRVRELTGTGGKLNGFRGSRSFQDDGLSVTKAIDRRLEQAEQLSFPPRPSLLPQEREADRRLLPPGRGTEP